MDYFVGDVITFETNKKIQNYYVYIGIEIYNKVK